METLELELLHPKALQLLKDLEELHLIKFVNKPSANEEYEKLSEKYEGKLSKEVAEELQQYVKKSREEWDRDI